MATKDNKNQLNIFDLDESGKQKNVGMKKSETISHQIIDQFPDTIETEDPSLRYAKNEKKKKLGIFERKKEEQKEDEILDTQIISHELIESSSRSNSVERFFPNVEFGLNEDQIHQRQKEGLVNDNQRTYSKTYRQIFINNIFTFFNVLCIGVAIALIIVQSYNDLSFLAILIINTVIGIVQEIKAKKTIDKLSIVTAPSSTVIREGITKEIPVTDIVLDDIIKLKNGKQISSDSVIVEGTIEVNESLLTGESVAIKKTIGDSLYAGSFVTSGNCYAKVNRVGKDCYIQKLQAKAKRYSKPRSELLRSIKLITTFIGIIIIPIGSIVAWRNYSTATTSVDDATFGTSGLLNVYGVDTNRSDTDPISLNSFVTKDGNIATVDFTSKNTLNISNIDRIKIAYTSKSTGNVSVSKISIYELNKQDNDGVVTYFPCENPIYTISYNESNIDDSIRNIVSYSDGIDRYADGSIRLDSSGDYFVSNQFIRDTTDLLETYDFQVRITLQSRAYTMDTEEEKNVRRAEILRITITKTAGSIVGMIPAGMFLLVTVALAVSVMRLAKSKTLVQELYCIEMLARVDCICLDKTGTITDGTMRVKEIIDVGLKDSKHSVETIMGSFLGALEDNNQTSIALQDKFGVNFELKKTTTISFSSVRKMSAASFEDEGTYILGAPEYVYQGKSKKILALIAKKAAMGYRVLMLAHSNDPIKNDKIPSQNSPISIFVLEDHIRDEATETIKWFNENGVQVKVISGDNPATVAEIAGKVGIESASDYISLEGLSPKEVEIVATEYTVFGRVSPDQKAILIKTLKLHGKTVAMTGDGVNDILAMKEADCSIAMASGSEAARNVSHLVLLDSNFANMPKVVLEGRRVINNIQRSASLYLMKTLFTMVITMLSIFATNIFVSGYPFVPRQFMLLEMFVIGVPSFVLALQPNKNKIKGGFLSNVFATCLTQAICLVLPVLIIFIVKAKNLENLSFTAAEATSLSVICITYVGFILLTNVCRPFNTLRASLCIMMFIIITVAFSIPSISELFGVTTLFKDMGIVNLLFVLVLILAIIPIARSFSDFIEKIRTENKKEVEEELKSINQ